MKLKHIKIKPTIVKIKDLNNDAPYNGELFAEAMLTQIHLAKKTEPIPTWTTRRECLSHNRRIIKGLLAPKDSDHEYDYKNQAWLVNGKYVRCGHAENVFCLCFGRLHEGEEKKESEAK